MPHARYNINEVSHKDWARQRQNTKWTGLNERIQNLYTILNSNFFLLYYTPRHTFVVLVAHCLGDADYTFAALSFHPSGNWVLSPSECEFCLPGWPLLISASAAVPDWLDLRPLVVRPWLAGLIIAGNRLLFVGLLSSPETVINTSNL